MLNFKKIAFCIVTIVIALSIFVGCNVTDTTTTTTAPDTTTTTTNNNSTTTTTTNNTTTTTEVIGSTTTAPLGDFEVYGETIRYDIDNDGHEEFCMIEPIRTKSPEGVFRFIVLDYETDLAPKYYAIYSYEKWHDQSFAKTADGKTGLIHTHFDPEITDVTFWDMSVENGRIVFKENGKTIAPYDFEFNVYWEDAPDDLSFYYFDEDQTHSVEIDGNGQKEIVTLGYLQYAESENEAPQTYWVLGIVDLDNPEMSQYCSLGIPRNELSFDIDEHTNDAGIIYNHVYIEELGSPQYICTIMCMDEGFGAGYWLTQAIR